MKIAEYINKIKTEFHVEGDTIMDDDLAIDHSIISSCQTGDVMFSLIRRHGTIIFEKPDMTSSKHLQDVLEYYLERDDIIKCYELTVKDIDDISVRSLSVDDFRSIFSEHKEIEPNA